MGMYTHKVSVTVTGSAGSASGTGVSQIPANGEIMAVYVKYTAQPATTDVTLATAGNNSPAQTILALTGANTDGWFYPFAALHKNDGTALTFDGTHPVVDEFPVDDYLKVAVVQGDPGTVEVWIIVEC